MGRGDPRQRQLSFDASKVPKQWDPDNPMDSKAACGSTSPTPLDGAVAIMPELKAGFKAIDSLLDELPALLDRMQESLDRYSTRMEGAKRCISDEEDAYFALIKRVEKTERLLKVATKNEDLEALFST
ncbi:hypothetical protein NDU88_006000 [Pleurodeles waltl]|uniref:Inhibitor of growth protein N-terminal histone-binding domain-containing protein n=1 Tax=Pleurodeles waltl TaxID=8319 RepID=A0AAV7RKC8_PLEWA|nr:hypothetical protein NDU88_006000 [Pleurodeles waltl]